ncbi:MAG TPA: CpcT/CpeT family chromophore lyase, partial [Flavobacteriales bacterium]|nr:CpcT/CpeT family chromophore lyase [Flavobacteriales bacterium]
MRCLIALFLVLPLVAPAQSLAELASWMTGSFSSAAQAEADTNYYAIELEMARIWPERTDGVWLYVEQAVAAKKEKPYRQRVY